MGQDTRHEIHAVAETVTTLWFVELSFEPGASGHAVGSVYANQADGADDEEPVQVLATNDTLTGLWAAPSGSVWVASASGHVATTARVEWKGSARARYTSKDPEHPWAYTALPMVDGGVPANITALWGLSEQCVFAGTTRGHIFQWDGDAWTQTHDGSTTGRRRVRAFGGRRSAEVLAIGEDGLLLSREGAGWRELAVPGPANGRENLTGIHVEAGGDVLVSASGQQGRLLRGRAGAMTEQLRAPLQLLDLVPLGARTLFATSEGVAELIDGELQLVKPGFSPSRAWPGRDRVFFTEGTQPVARYVEHDPRDAERAWARITH